MTLPKPILACLFLSLLIMGSGRVEAAGFQRILVDGQADKPLAIGIWYPSDAPVPPQPNTPFRQALAIDGPIVGERLPLVVISHGWGGWMGGHADTALALAEAGFVVVALTHPGNNYEDESDPLSRSMVERPKHVRQAVDYMLDQWREGKRIDASRIGIFGFSAGGYTALVSIGGIPDPERVRSHCAARPRELACGLGIEGLSEFSAEAMKPLWRHDFRIKAAVIAAPGLGFSFSSEGLSQIKAPVQLWAMSEDEAVPYETNTEIVRRSLPVEPDFRRVEGAGHFAFLTPCNPRLEKVEPQVWSTICVDPVGFDRRAFHQSFNRDIVSFFRRTLEGD